MATRALDVFQDVATILQDREHVRWTLEEKRLWLNAGLREVPIHKPNAKVARRRVTLDAGTYQTIPDGDIALLSAIRNIASTGVPVIGKGAVRMVGRADMDAQDPSWHDSSVHTAAKIVKNCVPEPADETAYYVWPPNDGTGMLELLTAAMPTPLVRPSNPEMIDSYVDEIDLDDIYRNALTDYVLYRCYAKDAQFTGNAARAAAAYALFGNALGVKLKMEMATVPE